MALAEAEAWPDFENARLEDWDPIAAILTAIDERRAVAAAVNETEADSFYAMSWAGIDRGWPPTREALESIRDAFCSLAAIFVFPDDGSYQADGFASFPARTIDRRRTGGWFAPDASRPLLGEHSIADPPDPGSSELSPEALRKYREWLANCAWWLERIRYLDATSLCRYSRKATLATSMLCNYTWMYDDGVIDDGEMPSGSISYNLDIEEREDGYPSSSVCSFSIDGWFFANDYFGSDPDCTAYRGSISKYAATYGGVWYSGFSSINPAGLPARLLVIPTHPRSGRFVQYADERFVQDSILSEPILITRPNGDKVGRLSEFSSNIVWQVFTHGSWRTWIDRTERSRYFGEDGEVAQYRTAYREVEYGWPPDNPDDPVVVRVENSNEITTTPYKDNTVPQAGRRITGYGGNAAASVFDGFGEGFEIGIPFVVPEGNLPPMSERILHADPFSPRDDFPLPDAWSEFLQRGEEMLANDPLPRGYHESVSFACYRRLCPLLDYGPFFLYGRATQQ